MKDSLNSIRGEETVEFKTASSVFHDHNQKVTPEEAYDFVWNMSKIRENFSVNRGRHTFCEGQLHVFDCFILAEFLRATGACTDCVDEARDAACEAQYELFREYLPERFPTPKHCRRGLELYDACTFLVAQYIRESGYDKSGYFAAMDARASEEEYVTAELNFRLNELLQEKRNTKRKVAMAQ
ncbi:DUF3445 domain-containing protein [Verrucomicrobia bacterium]|jgi:hypothetical protein|nr:DUF3445 domain-containing protein [Verrucomicrobiota bacterium]